MYEKQQLKNGIQVVYKCLEGYESVTLGVWVKTGSAYESSDQSGVSHFIEHMLFKGTEHRSAQKIALEMDAIGAEINAFTTKESTCFYTKTLSEDLERAIDVLSDMFIHPLFDEKSLGLEKNVILDEINMYEDSPDELVADLLNNVTFKDHALSMPILGTHDSVNAITVDLLRLYFNTHYRTDNMVIAVAGKFIPEKLLNLLEQYFSEMPSRSGVALGLSPAVLNWGVASKKKEIEQIQVSIDFPGIAFDDVLNYDMSLLSNVFGGSGSSRLFQTIREERGLSYGIYSEPTFYDNVGTLNISFGTSKRHLKEIFKLILEQIHLLTKEGISIDEINRTKTHLKARFLLDMEGTEEYMDLIGRMELFAHKERSLKDIVDKIDRITEESVNQVISLCFSEKKCAMAFVGDITEEEAENHYKRFVQGL